MQIQEIMTRSVDVIDPNTTIRDAARKMRSDNVGALPVGENDRLIGMVTDRDIVVPRTAGAAILRYAMSCPSTSIIASRTMTWGRPPR
jgi:CBS domain-containing protein